MSDEIQIEYDEAKRQWTLENRSLDFEDARIVLSAPFVVFDRQHHETDHGPEWRSVLIGDLHGVTVTIVTTPRGGKIRIISMRKANRKERSIYAAEI